MIQNVLHEPNLVAHYQKEYLTLLNYYEQIVRPSIFVKYYNISLSSVYDENSFSTYDYYNSSNIKFNIYDFTPLFFMQTVNNRPMHEDNKTGYSLQTQAGMVVNTIERPRYNDLIEFYEPIRKSHEIFRVINFTTVTNMLHSNPSSEWFELEVEYAPIENTSKLNILNQYVYDLSEEKNIPIELYRKKISKLENINILLNELSTYYFKNWDIYVLDYNLIPIATNDLIYLVKQNYLNKYKRLIENIKTPYGIQYYLQKLPYYDKNPFLNLNSYDNYLDVYNIKEKNVEKYHWKNINEYNNELEKIFYLSNQLAQEVEYGPFTS